MLSNTLRVNLSGADVHSMEKTFKETSFQRLFLGLGFPGGRCEHAGEVVWNVNGWSFIPDDPVGPGCPGSSHPRNPCFA